MNDKADVEILPEDKLQLTQEQQNLIELAFEKQVSPEDTEFIEKVQKETIKNASQNTLDPFAELSGYSTTKYGKDFGMIYLAAITGGEERKL